MSFYLVRLDPDGEGFVETPVADFGPYESGGEAAKMAKALSAQLGQKVQPRRIRQAPDWRERQRQRLADGTLKPLPEKWDLPPITDHFAHLSSKDASKIAFTEDDEKGAIDRATVLTPGRYLTRFYPGLSDAEMRRLVALIDAFSDIRLAFEPDEIARIYRDGPHSCMAGSKFNHYETHPCSVYGAGDLAIAYMVNPRSKSISCRGLVWPEKKLYGTLYGDDDRLRNKLEEEGYEDVGDNGGFFGARLLKIPTRGEPDRFYMPYFDDIDMAVDNGDHFLIVEDAEGRPFISSGGTMGKTFLMRYCPKYHSSFPASTFRFVRGVDEHWSGVSIEAFAFTCALSGEIWPDDQAVMYAGQKVSRAVLKQRGLLEQPKPVINMHEVTADMNRIVMTSSAGDWF
jgi:hypothetical protein